MRETTECTEWQMSLSGVSIMMVRLGGARPPPFTLQCIYHHVQSCGVRSNWEGRCTPPISTVPRYALCEFNQFCYYHLSKDRTFTDRLFCVPPSPPSVSSMKSGTPHPHPHTTAHRKVHISKLGWYWICSNLWKTCHQVRPGKELYSVTSLHLHICNLLLLSVIFMTSHNMSPLHRQNLETRIRDHVYARIHIKKSIVRN